MSEYDLSNAAWISSRACNNSACVQVAHLPGGMVGLRDSKDTNKAAPTPAKALRVASAVASITEITTM